MIDWKPIADAKRDGRTYLLWFPPNDKEGQFWPAFESGGAIEGWWFSSPKQIDNGWETVVGFVGEPTHFAEYNEPEAA